VSVINKMLRDLDARRAGGALPDLQRHGGPDALLGTYSVAPARSASSRRLAWLTGLLAGGVLVAGGWYVLGNDVALPPAAAPASAVTPVASAVSTAPVAAPSEPMAPATSAPASAPAAAPLGATAAAAPQLTPPGGAPQAGAIAVRAESVPAQVADKPAAQKERQLLAQARPAPVEPRVRAPAVSRPPSPPVQTTGQPKAAAATASAPGAAASAPVSSQQPVSNMPERRQAAARETLAQAQGLWAAGSREAALATVSEALALAERSQPVDATAVAMLAREQVRMDLVFGRADAALAQLRRLEPLVGNQADLWAVRANAAQRLGRHAEAVQAYQRALQLHPGESRWMLGAAVSLAAQGQLDAAARQAESARALGPVSQEVWSYLRQAGVPLR
jgi:Flp pilus assembly protein TadD